MRRLLPFLSLSAALLGPAALAGQDRGGFTIIRGVDTLAVERFERNGHELTGSLVRGDLDARERVRYHLTVPEEGGAALLELTAWRASDPEESPPRQTVRVIFLGDSVAVDEASRWGGVVTQIFRSERGAVPYLEFSTALLEEATRRAGRDAKVCLKVPFFNLGGGQTAPAAVCPVAADSSTLTLGRAEFRMKVDGEGRILGGVVTGQDLVILRQAGS